MVITFYGTGAELIKMYGVIKNIPRDQQLLICTAQQHAGLQKVHEQLDIYPDIYLAKGWRGKDVANMRQMLALMLRAHGSFFAQYTSIKKRFNEVDKKYKTKSVVLVHGDTLTTVVGSYLGRMLRLPVAHVEAGLRSGSWKSPFPEELDRRIAAKISTLHFPPSESAENNLRKEHVRGDIVNTHYNTSKDAIEKSDEFVSAGYKDLNLPDHYLLVLLHRTELLENKDDFEAILKVIHEYASQEKNVVFTTHTTTASRIRDYGFEKYLKSPYIHQISKQPYFDFMAIVKASDCIITDGGGLQEDAFFLGIPTIIHRQRTERQDGLGINAELSKMDVEHVRTFLKHHKNKSELTQLTSDTSPSRIVADHLEKMRYFAA